MTVICQLHGAGWRLSVSYMRQDDSYLSATSGRLALYVSYMRHDDDYVRCMGQDDGYMLVT